MVFHALSEYAKTFQIKTVWKKYPHRLSYEERLKKIHLPSLQYRRFRGDLIETYKIAHCHYDKASVNSLLRFRSNSRLRGHEFTIIKNTTIKNSYQHFFSNRVCNTWNNLICWHSECKVNKQLQKQNRPEVQRSNV